MLRDRGTGDTLQALGTGLEQVRAGRLEAGGRPLEALEEEELGLVLLSLWQHAAEQGG